MDVHFPEGHPVVIFGENNAGKSNLVSALDLLLGERYPGNYNPEDHELHKRSNEHLPMQVQLTVEGVTHVGWGDPQEVQKFVWRYPAADDDERTFKMELKNGATNPFVSNKTRQQCFCLLVGADRRLHYQLSYTSQWTFLSRLMRKFHEALVADDQRVEALQDHFEQLKSLFQGVPEFNEFSEALAQRTASLSGNFEYQLGIDFSAYDPSNYFKSLRVFPSQDGEVRSFDELGTGQEQVLAIAFAWAYAEAFHGDEASLILAIEEPESHLHPLAQRWLARQTRDLAARGVQVVITTHSPAFMDVRDLAGFVRVSKRDESSRVHQHTVESFVEHCRESGASADVGTTLSRYAAWSTEDILSGLLARVCVIVEGATEALALPELLRGVDFDAEQEGTAFINVHGVGNLAKWWRFFSAYDIPCYAFFDRDEGEDRNGAKRLDLARAAGMDEEYMQGLLDEGETAIDDRIGMFSPDYEAAMRSVFGDVYVALEEEARDTYGLTGGDAKPLVGRYAAQRVVVESGGEAEAFLELLAGQLRELRK